MITSSSSLNFTILSRPENFVVGVGCREACSYVCGLGQGCEDVFSKCFAKRGCNENLSLFSSHDPAAFYFIIFAA